MSVLRHFFPVADAIASLFGRDVEVVLHDLKTGKIAYIAHATSKRKPGHPSFLDLNDDDRRKDVLGPYEKAEADGGLIRSVSVYLENDEGQPIGLLCINLNLAKIEAAAKLLGNLFHSSKVIKRPESLFRRDWREQANLVVRSFVNRKNKSLTDLSRDERVALLAEIENAGLLEARHAAPCISRQLGVLRATFYSCLKQIRDPKKRRK